MVNPFKASSAHDKEGTPEIALSLLPKLLRTLVLMLCSRSFYFSYDLDITRRLGTQLGRSKDLPLHKAIDPLVLSRYCLSPTKQKLTATVLLESPPKYGTREQRTASIRAADHAGLRVTAVLCHSGELL